MTDFFFDILETHRINNDRLDDIVTLWKITLICKYGVARVSQAAKMVHDDYLFSDLNN